MLDQALGELEVATAGAGFVDVTARLGQWLEAQAALDGAVTVFIRHTSASLVVQENADGDVRTDLERFFDRLAPQGRANYLHRTEGPDDMPAHIKAALTATSITIPVREGRLALGTWQALYVAEFRAAPHRRTVSLHFVGTRSPRTVVG